MNCVDCGTEIPLPSGRGRHTARCDRCRADRKRTLTERRSLRLTVKRLDEMVAIETFLAATRREVERRQEGACIEGHQLHERQPLMLTYEHGEWFGLCPVHHEAWMEGERYGRG